MHENKSDVARLRNQIIEEMEAMRQGVEGFASGTARHAFISARMRNINDHQESLAQHIGVNDAATVVCELYIDTVEKPVKKRKS